MILLMKVTDPRYSTADKSMIDMTADFNHIGTVLCSFHPDDEQMYSFNGEDVTNGQIYSRASAGEFGPVAEYVAPTPPAEQKSADPLDNFAPSCALWQIQATLSFAQWNALSLAVQGPSAPATLRAFFSHGGNIVTEKAKSFYVLLNDVLKFPEEQTTALIVKASTVVVS